MKKLLAGLLLTMSATAFAGPYHGHGRWHNGYHGHRNWTPFIVGAVTGAVVYDIYNRPVVVQQPPVVVQQPPVVVHQQNCTPWLETQAQDGTITRTRTCTQ